MYPLLSNEPLEADSPPPPLWIILHFALHFLWLEYLWSNICIRSSEAIKPLSLKLLGIGRETSSFNSLLFSEGSLSTFPWRYTSPVGFSGWSRHLSRLCHRKTHDWEGLAQPLSMRVWKHFKGGWQDKHWHTYLIFITYLLKFEGKKLF